MSVGVGVVNLYSCQMHLKWSSCVEVVEGCGCGVVVVLWCAVLCCAVVVVVVSRCGRRGGRGHRAWRVVVLVVVMVVVVVCGVGETADWGSSDTF